MTADANMSDEREIPYALKKSKKNDDVTICRNDNGNSEQIVLDSSRNCRAMKDKKNDFSPKSVNGAL